MKLLRFFAGFVILISVSFYSTAIAAITTNDTYQSKQYYLDNIKAKDGWSIQQSSYNVIVAVIDDGVYDHQPDLRLSLWTNADEIWANNIDDDNNGYVDDRWGWDFLSKDGDMRPRGTHGTAVGGIIGALSNNNEGIAGLASGTILMPLIACDNQPSSLVFKPENGCQTQAIIDAIKYAADNGANIINLSLGGDYTEDFDSAIQYAYNKGVLIVAAAGNENISTKLGNNLTEIPQSPVCNDNGANMILGVTGLSKTNTQTEWSAFGSCVDVAAPGEDIFTTAADPYSGRTYLSYTGTSYATPMVSALAALIKEKDKSLTNKQISDIIINTAENRPEYNNMLGKGLINYYSALKAATSGSVLGVGTTPSHPKGSVVLGSDNRTVYVIENGVKRGFATPEEYNSQGFVFSEIVKANTADLALPDGSIVPFSDGTLVLDTTDNRTVYIIYNGKKRGFTNEEVFLGLGYSFAKAVRGNLVQYPAGNPIGELSNPHPEGSLVKDGSAIYKIASGGKQAVPSMNVFNSWHWKMDNVLAANEADKVLALIGEVKFRNGTLLKPANGTIYFVSDSKLRPFESMSKLQLYSYNASNALLVTNSEIGNYEVGPSL